MQSVQLDYGEAVKDVLDDLPRHVYHKVSPNCTIIMPPLKRGRGHIAITFSIRLCI